MTEIFISYSWANKNIVEELEELLKDYEVIRSRDFVIMLISDSFLKSENCMFEVLEFIKETNFKSRILPIIHNTAKGIFNNHGKALYVKYWQNKLKDLEKETNDIYPLNMVKTIENMKKIENICRNIDDILDLISDMKNIVIDDSMNSNFKDILDIVRIEKRGVKII